MKKRILLVGANSDIARSLTNLHSGDYDFITFSRGDLDSQTEHYTLNVINDDLPQIEGAIDGLVYFPGTIRLKPFRSLTTDDFIEDFEINFLGAVRVIKTFLKNLLKSESASVVLISSVAASKGMPYHSSISASKAAIEGFTRSMAAEYASKLRFNAVAPSLTDTQLASNLLKSDSQREQLAANNPMNRIGKASDISEMISFLLSDKSEWISGQVFNVDGGMSVINRK